MSEILDEIKKSNPKNTYAKLALFFACFTILNVFYLQYLLSQNASVIFVESTAPSYLRLLKLIFPFSLLSGIVFSALSLQQKETWKFWKRFAIILNLLLVTLVFASIIFTLYIDLTHRQ